MKKLAILVSLLLLASYTDAFALLRLGLKAGVNLANVTVDKGETDYQMKPGFIAGAMGEIPVSPGGALAVRTELLYVQKGAKFTQQSKDGKLLTDELVLAPFLVFRLPTPQITPFLQAGPEFGFNTLAKKDYDGTKDIGPHWKNNNFSINLGGGVMIPALGSDLTLDFRYNLGLVDMSLGQGDFKTKTNGIQLLLGYNFLRI
ncbi:PorT family protein [bacterium]|nr:PorT family protein [bacterium]MBU1984182.1 PorT family protein [bacterium]